METVKVKRAINELHTDTRILYNVLESKLIKEGGEIVTYDELLKAIGRDVRSQARGLLKTARKHIEKEHHITLECVRNVGIKRTEDYCGIMDKTTQHVRKQTRVTAKRVLNAINDKNLQNDEKILISAKLSQFGAIELFTRNKTTKRLEEHIKLHDGKELATTQTLKLFTDKEKNNQTRHD